MPLNRNLFLASCGALLFLITLSTGCSSSAGEARPSVKTSVVLPAVATTTVATKTPVPVAFDPSLFPEYERTKGQVKIAKRQIDKRFTYVEKRAIISEFLLADRRAEKDARKQYTGHTGQNVMLEYQASYVALEDRLKEKYEAVIIREHRLTDCQYSALVDEAADGNWQY